ncbi:MAG: heme-binding protein, partial [Lachnospiraceae bacterium]|nr:heme-binding protein [Lachnospiraceae bacterium]
MKEQLIYQAVEQALREAGKSAMTMTLDMAKKLAGQVEQKAKEMGIPVVIAVADKAARPVAIH